MPITDIDADMPKWGWVKSITWYQLEEREGRAFVTEWDFYAEDIPCPHCGKNDRVWVWIPPHNHAGGVFLGCSLCKRTYGPLDAELYSSTPRGKRRELNLSQLAEICKRTKQDPPSRRLQFEIEKRKLGSRKQPKRRPRPPKFGQTAKTK